MAAAMIDTEREYHLWIGGEPVKASNGTYEIINPATEELVGLAPEASADDARAAAESAAAAFPAWSQTTPEERAALLNRAADLLTEHYAEFVPLVQAETGSTLPMAQLAQVGGTIARIRRFAKGALEPLDTAFLPVPNMGGGPHTTTGGVFNAAAVRLPVGVVACIKAYNVPMNNIMGTLGPALATGNTVVVKPAGQDPLAVIRLVELFNEAGFPPGVVNLIVGSGADASQALVASPQVDMVSFTGSTEVGLRIAEAAGRDLKRVLMELGGKGASVVFEGADLDAAAEGTASTFTYHAGQICTAPTRLIAQRSVYDQVVEKLAAIAKVVKVGDPADTNTVMGPVITGAHRDRVVGYIRSGIEEGGTIVAGGPDAPLDRGYFVQPTLIADCRPGMKAVQEEIFGPVVVAMPFDDEEEGIALANGTDFGLYSYVWTGDTAQGMRIARRIRAGNIGINTVGRHMETPFGGFKKSGIGRDGGSYGLLAYTELQSIVWPG
ncbi:MAG TPA: aldehyde dehydrogenase family protein [Acidimicrobiales bacterium]|nr:aldehyde dehydrogenase family protein [Acidimicrobiales bacterium]